MANILIVEDEREIMDVYKEEFEEEGYHVYSALDGVEAIDMIKEISPDLVILDIIMPRKTGFDVLGFMQNDPLYREIPVLVLTNIILDRQEMLRKYHIADFLLKVDHTPGQLVEKCRKLLVSPISGS